MGEVSNAFVVAMGIGVVFVGLICIVVLCMVMSRLCRPGGRKEPTAEAAAAAVSKPAEQSGTGEKDIAVLTAVITAAITAAASDRPAAAVRSAAVPGRRVAAPSSYRPVMPPGIQRPPGMLRPLRSATPPPPSGRDDFRRLRCHRGAERYRRLRDSDFVL